MNKSLLFDMGMFEDDEPMLMLNTFRRVARLHGWTDDEILAVVEEAMDGNYPSNVRPTLQKYTYYDAANDENDPDGNDMPAQEVR